MLNIIRYILVPFVPLYAAVIKLRNYLFEKGKFRAGEVNIPVISIGNITVGGSGKTPSVIYLAELLKKAGKNPAILSRGYRRSTRGYLLAGRGGEPVVKVSECGDEMYLVTSECKVPSAVSENRVKGAKRLIEETGPDTIILDDAFQHRWIKRDLDILIYDQRFLLKTGSTEQSLLPLGNMREPFASSQRADIIIINRKFSEKKEIPAEIMEHFRGKDIYYAYYDNDGIYDLKTKHHYSIAEFEGQKSLVVCGIARPYSFLHTLENNGVDIRNKILFNDHKEYTNHEVQEIRKEFYQTNSHSVLTTQKDAVKLTAYAKQLDDIDIYYLKIALRIENSEEFDKKVYAVYEKKNILN